MPEVADREEERDRGSGQRTVALLKQVAEFGGPFTLSALAARANLPASSVHRLLQPLLRSGFVERATGQAYRPGSEFLRIAALVLREVDVRALARPLLRGLWDRWQETCSLCLFRPETHRALVVETIQTPNPLRFVLEPFAELSLTWGSLGRAILAFLPDADADAALQRPGIGPLSGLAAPSREELEPEMRQIRAAGYAFYRNLDVDVAGVAAPVRSAAGNLIGSIGITLPAQRLAEARVAEMAAGVMEAAARLSADLGHSRP